MTALTERDTAERVLALIGLADQLRVPGHRRTAETCMEAQDEVRSGLRRLDKDLTGADAPLEAKRRAAIRASLENRNDAEDGHRFCGPSFVGPAHAPVATYR